jgi:hypothetical protein
MELEPLVGLSNSQTTQKPRVSSALRMKYEAEVQLIRHKWGSLEDMRKTLGLSQRKMCQLLLVDPSAWTRWTRSDATDEAPPHIYRSLSWYLLLRDESPELSPYVFLQTVARPQIPEPEIKKVTERISENLKMSLNHKQDLKHELIFDEISQLKNANKTLKMWLLALSTGLVVLVTLLLLTKLLKF